MTRERLPARIHQIDCQELYNLILFEYSTSNLMFTQHRNFKTFRGCNSKIHSNGVYFERSEDNISKRNTITKTAGKRIIHTCFMVA